LWNYAADNTNARGEGWNDEDLSIFSRDQLRGDGSPDDGGRALEAVVRPYPMAVPGTLESLSYDVRSREFACTFRLDGAIDAPAEFFVPLTHYPYGAHAEAPDGRVTLDGDRLVYAPDRTVAVHSVRLRPKPPEGRTR
jgi:hypothetical protein